MYNFVLYIVVPGIKQQMPIYQSNENLLFSTDYPIPRLAAGSFTLCLKTLFRQFSGKELDVITYGKPMKITYEYAEHLLNGFNEKPVLLLLHILHIVTKILWNWR